MTTPQRSTLASWTDVRGQRYCEVFAVDKHHLHAKARIYSTFGLNDCPCADWSALDHSALKAELHADEVVLNGPRFWTMDAIAAERVHPSEVVSAAGLQLRLIAGFQVSLPRVRQQRQPYTELTVERSTEFTFLSGSPVYELTAPNGGCYVMQSYSHIVDDSLTLSDLDELDQRLSLPSGWRWERRILTEDLVMRTGGKATVVQDDFLNTYQAQRL